MIISWLLSKVDKDTKENIVFGLAVGLMFGLAYGLVFGLAVGLFPFNMAFILGILAVIEVLYWCDREPKPIKVSKWQFMAKKKFEAAIEVGLGLGAVAYIIEAQKHWKEISEAIGIAGYYAFMFLGIVGVIGVWLWLNSLKYHEKKRGRGRPRRR